MVSKCLRNSLNFAPGQRSLNCLLSGSSHLPRLFSAGVLFHFGEGQFVVTTTDAPRKQCPVWAVSSPCSFLQSWLGIVRVSALCFNTQLLSHTLSHLFGFWKKLIPLNVNILEDILWEQSWHFDVLLDDIQLPVFRYSLQRPVESVGTPFCSVPKPCQMRWLWCLQRTVRWLSQTTQLVSRWRCVLEHFLEEGKESRDHILDTESLSSAIDSALEE